MKEWDIVVPADIPSHNKTEVLNKQEKFLNALTDRLRFASILGINYTQSLISLTHHLP